MGINPEEIETLKGMYQKLESMSNALDDGDFDNLYFDISSLQDDIETITGLNQEELLEEEEE